MVVCATAPHAGRACTGSAYPTVPRLVTSERRSSILVLLRVAAIKYSISAARVLSGRACTRWPGSAGAVAACLPSPVSWVQAGLDERVRSHPCWRSTRGRRRTECRDGPLAYERARVEQIGLKHFQERLVRWGDQDREAADQIAQNVQRLGHDLIRRLLLARRTRTPTARRRWRSRCATRGHRLYRLFPQHAVPPAAS